MTRRWSFGEWTYDEDAASDESTLDSLVEAWLTGILGLLGISSGCDGTLRSGRIHSARSRTHESGIRFALGARPGLVQGLFILRGLRLALSGVLDWPLGGL